jgi:hypothetical protein
MVSRLESTQPYYEFFNMLVEIHRKRGRTLPAMRLLRALPVAAALLLCSPPVHAADVRWEHWTPIPRVFDVGGPRNGFLVVAGSAGLYLIHPEGEVATFARGGGGYHDDPGAEAYIAVSPGGDVGASNCDFRRDETFILRLHAPLGVTRVDAAGVTSSAFANITGMSSLNGIAFDTTGAFDHRLLVSGSAAGKIVIAAIDCKGAVQVITTSAPTLEGGLAVAPRGFGAFGGDLIAPDELSGHIYAIAPDGTVTVVAQPPLPAGGDIGVEGIGFVPPGFTSDLGGAVYFADRKSPGSPHPGNDAILRMSSAILAAAQVQDGDMLVATEGGATMVAVRCAASCTVIPVVTTPTTAHGEGHLVFTVTPAASPAPSRYPRTPVSEPTGANDRTNGTIRIAAILLVIAAAAFLILRRRHG